MSKRRLFSRRHPLVLQVFCLNLVSLFVGFGIVPFLFMLVQRLPFAETFLQSYSGSPYFDVVLVVSIWCMNFFFYLLTFYLLFRKKQRYLQEIIKKIASFSQGNIGGTLPVRGDDEIADICRTINKMSAELAAQIAKEKEAEQEKMCLIRNMGHDLRTPLTSIQGYLQLLEDKQYCDEAEHDFFVQTAAAKTKQLTRLIETLFEYTRLNDPTWNLPKIHFNFCQMVKQMVVDYTPLVKKAGLVMRADIRPECPFLEGNPESLARILENLFGNAIKYATSGGHIDVQLFIHERRHRLMVSNDCPPITEAELGQIFQRFYRLEQSRSTKTGGNGLGLAIVKSIAERHGGSVSAEYYNGQIHFIVDLP